MPPKVVEINCRGIDFAMIHQYITQSVHCIEGVCFRHVRFKCAASRHSLSHQTQIWMSTLTGSVRSTSVQATLIDDAMTTNKIFVKLNRCPRFLPLTNHFQTAKKLRYSKARNATIRICYFRAHRVKTAWCNQKNTLFKQ